MTSNDNASQRPADRRRARVRAEILTAAEEVFAQEGASGLSIRRLAESIDYSPAAIYKYFESKTAVIDELKEAFFEVLQSRLSAVRTSDQPFEQRAAESLMTYVRTAIERPHHYAAAFSGVAGAPDEADAAHWDDFTHTHKGRAFLGLVALVEEGQSCGVFDTALNPRIAAKSVWASGHGLALLMIHIPGFQSQISGGAGNDTSVDFIATHAEMILRSLRVHSESSRL